MNNKNSTFPSQPIALNDLKGNEIRIPCRFRQGKTLDLCRPQQLHDKQSVTRKLFPWLKILNSCKEMLKHD